MICVAGCGDKPAVLEETSGRISLRIRPLVNLMECAWSIQVDKNKVDHLRNTLFILRLLKTRRSRWRVIVQIKLCTGLYQINIVNNITVGVLLVYSVAK